MEGIHSDFWFSLDLKLELDLNIRTSKYLLKKIEKRIISHKEQPSYKL